MGIVDSVVCGINFTHKITLISQKKGSFQNIGNSLFGWWEEESISPCAQYEYQILSFLVKSRSSHKTNGTTHHTVNDWHA